MSEVYEALRKMKSVARDKGWFAYKEGTPENDAYHTATKALNENPPIEPIDLKPEVTEKPKKRGKK